MRDELLRFFGLAPPWLVHGAAHDSLGALEYALILATRTAERVRAEGAESYFSPRNGRGTRTSRAREAAGGLGRRA